MKHYEILDTLSTEELKKIIKEYVAAKLPVAVSPDEMEVDFYIESFDPVDAKIEVSVLKEVKK